MEHYVKTNEINVPCLPPFPNELTTGTKVMVVKENTKFKNIFTYVDKLFQDANCRSVIFKGVGEATAKCISCVEVFKRNYKDGVLHQWNEIMFTRQTNSWTGSLSKYAEYHYVSTIFILISKDPFPEDYINASCQSSSSEETGFSFDNGTMPNGNNKIRKEKARLLSTSGPNKWNRPAKKNSRAQKEQSLSKNKSQQKSKSFIL
uniref:Alba domain-containing protein n=1 Tax=Elaeophora elaphi TaxID=1147741 RepID=A0A0R3RYK9_9BILA